jgi:hypothetical protein
MYKNYEAPQMKVRNRISTSFTVTKVLKKDVDYHRPYLRFI